MRQNWEEEDRYNFTSFVINYLLMSRQHFTWNTSFNHLTKHVYYHRCHFMNKSPHHRLKRNAGAKCESRTSCDRVPLGAELPGGADFASLFPILGANFLPGDNDIGNSPSFRPFASQLSAYGISISNPLWSIASTTEVSNVLLLSYLYLYFLSTSWHAGISGFTCDVVLPTLQLG